MKRGERLIVLGLIGLGLAWSWIGHAYDLQPTPARVLVTVVDLAGSFVLMTIALAAARVPPAGRATAALVAVLPWNAVLLSQLAYVGYLFIPLEVLASGLLLRRHAELARWKAFALASLTRAGAFALTLAAASVARGWFSR